MREGAEINKERISDRQVSMLVFLIITASIILFIPKITTQNAKQSAWILPISSSLIGFITLYVVRKLSQRFPRQTLPQFSEIILGKTIGKIIGSGYVLFFFIINVLAIREFIDFSKVSLLPSTPVIVLSSAIVMVGGYAAFKGIEVIARITQFVLPIFIFGVVLILALSLPNMDWEKLLPLFEGGIKPIVWSSVVPASWYGEIVVLVMLLPIANKHQEVTHQGVLVLLAAVGLLTAVSLVTLTVIGPHLIGDLFIPFWYLAGNIEFGNLIQRLESLFVFFWIPAIVVKIAFFHYMVCLTVAQVLGIKSYKNVLIPSAILLVMAVTFLFGNTLRLIEIRNKWWPPFGFFFELIIPLMLLILAIIRRKRGSVS